MTEKQKKQGRIIVVILLILLFVFYSISKDDVDDRTDDADDNDSGYPVECQTRELIECFSGCPNPQASFFKTLTCGVQDLCGNSTTHEHAMPPPCAPPPAEEPINDFVLTEDGNTTNVSTGSSNNTQDALDNSGWGLGVYGCMDPLALNYNELAGASDGSCYYSIVNDAFIYGCCNPNSSNYDSSCFSNAICTCNYNC